MDASGKDALAPEMTSLLSTVTGAASLPRRPQNGPVAAAIALVVASETLRHLVASPSRQAVARSRLTEVTVNRTLDISRCLL
jgi:hypothetical protein